MSAASSPSSMVSARGLREQILDAASVAIVEDGWSCVTMAKLAESVGVSRQTVYNEVGSKTALVESLVLRELEVFLAAVDAEMSSSADVVVGVRNAAARVLTMAGENPLLRSVLSASHGGANDLLPYLTIQSGLLLQTATTVVRERVDRSLLGLDERAFELATDAVVRLVLSHVMQPDADPEATADGIAWLAGRIIHGD